ncbi:Eco57I restriction-modification methylase domain-containing protein [Dehalococcoidia bacterium]|nr:Eco57I restriction-modification methylase domain-containing protein [Dehalococcoidia bacterium]
MERIGKYTEDENEIDLLIVKLKRETSLERARTMQRNFIAWYLKGSRGGKLKDAALVVFVSPDKEDWRFSLVNMDYRFEEGQSGRVKVKEEFTPARRWSFLVGKNERSHTAQSRLVSILEDDEHNPTLAQLEEAFNIEPVTKEFFDKYRILLVRTVDALDRVAQAFLPVKKDFELKNINTVDFAKKLLGQIVFLYFLQKKGWFGVKRDAEWGTGAKDFLRRLFEKRYGVYKNFFNDILEPLFYEALARERDDDFYSRFNCKIPFLNGGLFEPIGGYDWVHTDILLPDELFSNRRRTPEGDIGDGILDVFDRFNFTVKEDEPLEKEVAIDPELLGKLYEKFNAIRPDNFYEYKKALVSGKRNLEKQFNKKFGVYYTPREIVHYMCQQSLINYLSCELEGKVNKEDIEKLIKYGEQFTENEAAVLEKGKETQTYKYHLPLSIRTNAKFIDDKLKDIKICDPAIGSGAFPVGMMHEIIKTRNVLSAFINGLERSIYNFKRECIESSLYGVDIDAGACEVARLRLWLSLIVDEEDIRKIKPLPNLDYKIVCGNSLLGFPTDVLRNIKISEEIERLKERYFNETVPSKKIEIRNRINALFTDLVEDAKPFLGEVQEVNFDFHIHFSEVFHEKDGFDVVIANPPYVRADNPGIREQREAVKKLNIYKTLWEKWDLYVAFIEKGFDVLASGGILEFIISDAYMTSKYAVKSHEYFLKNAVINRINFCSDLKIFEAEVRNIIVEFRKEVNPSHIPLRIRHLEKWDNQIILPSKEQSEMREYTFKLDSENKVIGELSNTLSYGEICYVSVGMVLNADENLAKGEFSKSDLISDREDKIHSRKYLEAKWISKYTIEKLKYLEWNTKRVPKKIRRPTFPELYIPPKIMKGRMTGAIYDDTGLLCNDSMIVSVLWKDLKKVNNRSIEGSIKKDFKLKRIYSFRVQLEENSRQFDLKYLLAILNSKLAYKFLDSVRRSKLGFYPDDLKKLPIKKITYSVK